MHRLILLLMALSGALLASPSAFAEKRVALVIGNSAYQNEPKLPNPANDAAAIADMFRAAKFEVVESKHDLNIAQMRRAFSDFTDRARDADIAVVYYAGHGLEVDGVNYLIPVDAVLARDSDAFDEAIPLDRALQVIEPARQLRLVILDACRDNPIARSIKRTFATRSLGRGLAGVEPGRPNTLVAFAAKGGSTADDGDGEHSPFTASLLQHLTTPGQDIRRSLGIVRDKVMKTTADRQEPFVYGSLGGSDVALVPAPVAAAVVAQRPGADAQDIRRDYELALQLGTREGWTSFLREHPSGFYADLARGQLGKIASVRGDVKNTDDKAKAESGTESRATPVAPLPDPAANPTMSAKEIACSLQRELRRVGCFTSTSDGEWNAPSQRALERFNQIAGTKFDVKVASLDAIDTVKRKTTRVCPLVCDHGFRADGDSCIKISCDAGYQIGSDNTCEKIETKSLRAKPAPQAEPAKKPKSTVASQVAPVAKPAKPARSNCNPEMSDAPSQVMDPRPRCR